MKLALPTIVDLCSIIADVKKSVPRKGAPDYKDYCDYDSIMDDNPTAAIDVTIGWTPYDGWGYQTGDNSYSGAAYFHPIWAVARIARRDNARAIARDLIDDLKDGLEYWTEKQKEYNQ
jgi:hypothetical protein